MVDNIALGAAIDVELYGGALKVVFDVVPRRVAVASAVHFWADSEIDTYSIIGRHLFFLFSGLDLMVFFFLFLCVLNDIA